MPTVTGSSNNITHATAGLAADRESVSVSSVEQLYSPILIKRNGQETGTFPSFNNPQQGETGGTGVFGAGHTGPTRTELDPYFSNNLGDASWFSRIDFQFMANDGTGQNGPDTNIGKIERSTVSKVTVNHFRGPLCLAGWGTDIADRPYPNISDAGEDSWKINPLVAGDRSTHVAGPVDLKWDEERRVWSGGAHILCGVARSVPAGSLCNPSPFTVNILRLEQGRSGNLSNQLFGETVTAYNFDTSLHEPAAEGKKIFVIIARLNYKWIPIWVGCPECGSEEGQGIPCPQDTCATL